MKKITRFTFSNPEYIPLGFVGLLFIVLFTQSMQRGIHGNDLTVFLHASNLFFGGLNPYDTANYATEGMYFFYPPFSLSLFGALEWLPPYLAQAIWFAGNFIFFLFAVRRALAAIIGHPPTWALLAGVLAIFFNILQNNFLNGQANMLAESLTLLFIAEYFKNRDWVAALLIASAISIKISPVVFLAFCMVQKRWRVVGWSIVFSIILNLLFPFVAGIEVALEMLKSYFPLILGKISGGEGNPSWIFSITAFCGLTISVFISSRVPGRASMLAFFPVGIMGSGFAMQTHYLIWLLPPVMYLLAPIEKEGLRRFLRSRQVLCLLSLIVLISSIQNYLFPSLKVGMDYAAAGLVLGWHAYYLWQNGQNGKIPEKRAA